MVYISAEGNNLMCAHHGAALIRLEKGLNCFPQLTCGLWSNFDSCLCGHMQVRGYPPPQNFLPGIRCTLLRQVCLRLSSEEFRSHEYRFFPQFVLRSPLLYVRGREIVVHVSLFAKFTLSSRATAI